MNTTAEFLRKLADLIDSVQSFAAQSVSLTDPKSELNKRDPSGNEDNFQSHTAEVSDETEVMVPPLQQKIELLKKIAGVESLYDEKSCDCEGECDCVPENTDNEITVMRKNAGLVLATTDDFPEE